MKVNVYHITVHCLLAGMLVVPFLASIHRTVEASPLGITGFNAALLLNHPFEVPAFDRIAKIDRLIVAHYVPQPGENVWSIHQRFHIDQFSLRSSNDLDTSAIPAGTVLAIPNHRGTLFEVKDPENLHAISQDFTIGKKLGAQYEREILEMNNFPLPDLSIPGAPFRPGTVLFLPDAYRPTGLPFPFVGNGQPLRITSRFGMRKHPILGVTRPHDGFDIAKPFGTPVLASRQGTVDFAGWRGGYGNMIEVRHTIKSRSGTHIFFTRYGHLSKIIVHEGQHVSMYQMIGRVGSTGISTGPHLHFEIRDENGVARNPGNFQ